MYFGAKTSIQQNTVSVFNVEIKTDRLGIDGVHVACARKDVIKRRPSSASDGHKTSIYIESKQLYRDDKKHKRANGKQ